MDDSTFIKIKFENIHATGGDNIYFELFELSICMRVWKTQRIGLKIIK